MRAKMATLVCCFLASYGLARADEPGPPKPGPEQDALKKLVGEWDVTASFGGMETKGTAVYKLGFGGWWLTEDFTGEFGGQKFEVFTVPITKDAIDLLVDKLAVFWEFVKTKEAPPPQTQDEVKRLFAKDNGKEVIASPEVERACTWLSQVKENMKQLKEKKDSLEVEIKSLIADGATLKSQSGQVLATWKSAKDSLKFDKTRFMVENPETAARYTSMAPGSRRFLLK